MSTVTLCLYVISEEDIVLKSIAEVSPELTQFIEELKLRLSSPQQRHVKQIADGLVTIEGDKNLSNLYRGVLNIYAMRGHSISVRLMNKSDIRCINVSSQHKQWLISINVCDFTTHSNGSVNDDFMDGRT